MKIRFLKLASETRSSVGGAVIVAAGLAVAGCSTDASQRPAVPNSTAP